MKKNFTRFLAALALLLFIAIPIGVMGQTTTLVSGSGTSGYAVPDGWTSNGTVEGGSYLKFDNGTITSPEFAPYNGLSFTYSVATYGSGTNHPLTIRILNASTNNVIKEETTATPTSSSYISTGSPLSLGDVNVAFKIQLYAPSGKGVRLRDYSIIGTTPGGITTYSVTYNANGATSGTVPIDPTVYDDENSTVTVLGNTGNLAKTHYSFGGWNTQADGQGTNYDEDDTFEIEGNTTLYAKWIIITHTATFSVNGTNTSSQNFAEGATITFPANPADISGKTFVGWTESTIDGTTDTPPMFVNSVTMGTSDVTFYAVFADVTPGTTTIITDNLTTSTFGSPSTYTTWSGKSANGGSDAVYAGNSTTYNNTAIQIRATVPSGIVSTISGGKAKKVTVTWNDNTTNGRTLDVYGKNSAYTESANLYGTSEEQGVLMGSIVNGTSTELTISTDYEFIGIRSRSGAMYLNQISIEWDAGTPDTYSNYCTTVAAVAVEKPVITVAENPFLFFTTVSITCVTDGAVIKYSYDGENWNDYSTPFTINETKTIYAKGVQGEDESLVASVIATKNLAEPMVAIDATGITNTNVFTGTAAGSLAASVTYNNVAIDGAYVTWSGNNDEVATIDASTGAVTLVAAGSVTFIATYAGNADYSEKTATYEMFVTNINPNAPGTQNNPYTVAEARDAIDAEDDVDDVYVKGIVSEIVTAYSSQYHNISYNISADGLTSSDQLQAYRGKSYNGGNFTSEDDIQVGDSVVVFGDLQNYQGTYEFKANNELVYLMRKTITVDPNSTDVDADEHDGTLTLTISNMTVASTDDLAVQFYDAEGEELGSSAEPDWILFDDFEENNGIYTIDYTIGQNTTTDDRVAYLKVWTLATTQELDHVVYSNLVTIAQDAPIVIEYYQYSINGVEGDMVQTASGTSITLPTTVENVPQGFSFAGWTTDANDVSNILAPGASYTINATVEFFAVYSKTVSGTPVTAFNKVTSISEGDYLIVYETDEVAFDGGRDNIEDAIDAVENTIDIEFLSDGVIASNSTTDAAIFIIAESESKDDPTYTIQSVSGFYIGRTANSNGMNVNASEKYTNSITFDNSGNAVITASGGCVLKYNNASNQLRFRYYASGQKAIQLYKKTTSVPTVTTYYTRIFLNETATANITISGPSIISSGSTLNMNGNTLTSAAAANLVIDDGGQLIHDNAGVQATLKKNITGYGNGTGDWYFIGTGLADEIYANDNTLAPTGLLNGSYDLYLWYPTDDNSQEWWNYKANKFYKLYPNYGYLYANQVNNEINFAGAIKASNTPVVVNLDYHTDYEFGDWMLCANPFMCKATITASNNQVAYYRMNSEGTGYEASTAPIDPMEGVFVQSTAEGQTITFNRYSETAQPSQLNVNLLDSNAQIDNAIIRFDGGNNLSKLNFRDNSTKLYIPQGSKDYAVVRSANEGEMPVSFKAAENGTYTINVEPKNVEVTYLHLIDNLTGANVDLLANPSYTFEANKGDNASRFRLVFKAGTSIEENASTNSFAYFNGSAWVISNTGDATLQVIDMMGRVLRSEQISGNTTVNINEIAGVYMLRLVNGENVMVQKVVVR